MEFVKERSNPSPATFYAAFAVGILILVLSLRRRQARQLVGPPASSWLYGVSKDIFSSPEPGDLYADWAKVYGKVYQIPLAFGAKSMVLCDPKALAAFFSKDTSTYQQAGVTRVIFAKNFGQNVLTSELEDHKRQRRALSSGFSIAAIRDLTSVFYGSAYSAKASWDSIIQREATGYAVIDVQQWMNDISLDSIGIGGFSHDFGSTKGKTSEVAACFEALNNLKPSFGLMVRFVLVPILPILAKLPNKRNELVKRLSKSFRSIAVELLERARTEKVGDDRADKSILSVLIRSENASAKVQMDVDEIIAQINLFMLAGYETTATAMTWALIELSRHPEMQRKLRAELSRFGQSDPTYEQLGTEFPYLEAVTLETLRLHPSLSEVSRESHEDDILPLSEPIVDSYGKTIDRLLIPKGTKMRIPLAGINRLESLWGSDSHVFKPERWLDNGISKEKAAELQGYRHLLTFADGPRTCLGKLFAVTEFKSVLSVLIRNYSFELPNGPDTKIERRRALLPRPKVAGEEGTRVPLIVKRVE